MRPARLVELAGGAIIVGVAFRALAEAAPPVPGEWAVVNRAVVIAVSMAAGALLITDALAGATARIAARARAMPYTIRLGRLRVRVGNPEALLLSTPFWLATAAAAAAAVKAVYEPGFLASFMLALASTAAATLLTVKALTEDPLSVTLRKAGVAPRVAPSIPWYSRLARISILGWRPLEALASMLEESHIIEWLEARARQALLPHTRRELALAVVSGSAAGALAAAAASMALAALGALHYTVTVVVMLVGALGPLAALLVMIEAARATRASEAGEEAAWLALAGTSTARAGLGLDHALQQLATPDFPGLAREARELRRRIQALGEDPLSAIKGVGAEHPSPTLRGLLAGYVDLVLSGGDAVRYLQDWVRELLHLWNSRLRRFTEEAAALAEGLIALLALGPIVIIIGGLLLGAEALEAMHTLVFGVIPASLALAGLLAIRSPGRRARYDPRGPAALAALWGAVALLAMALAGRLQPGVPLWLQLGAPALAAMAGWQLAWRRQDAEEREEEKWLPYVLRRLAESKRLGQPLATALPSSSPRSSAGGEPGTRQCCWPSRRHSYSTRGDSSLQPGLGAGCGGRRSG